ncbi:hypothetical protein H9660_09510 [Clostridium sp. Sa3CUN1]|uniref:Uncharacterized protein n=1 Tax=Clostridium gallinarum TaxID=2762246 RepID=A0ABR8Q4X8_9CLOT|nr:hypothetical protein [Clostridium gallinarum]MBD7915384.1 hypothetical protein [Clostridium gallinarum]
MNFNGWGNLEDLLNSYGYNNNNNNNNNNTSTNEGCNDIPNGFQNLPPELVVLIAELLGNIIAGKIPFNLQNIIGNWFELLGQVILTFNAQQQYFQSGPGRYYDPKNFNITNPFCNNSTSNASSNTSSTSSKSNTDIDINKLENLEKQVQELTNEINKIKALLEK